MFGNNTAVDVSNTEYYKVLIFYHDYKGDVLFK